MKNKFFKPVLAFILLITMSVGGTLAYINAQTDEIENKFVFAHTGSADETLAIDLDEEFTLNDVDVSELPEGIAKFVPGDTIVKQPKVIVTENDLEDGAYVFIELKGDVDDILQLGFVVDTNVWTIVPNETHVYYLRQAMMPEGSTDVEYNVFSTYSVEFDKDYDCDDRDSTFDEVQSLIVDAYAIQMANLETSEDAWAALNGTTTE